MIDRDTGEKIEVGMNILEGLVNTITGGNLLLTPFLAYAL